MIPARDGIKLACHQYTPAPGTPAQARVLFLHGGSFNSRRYANFAKACAKQGFEAVLCDWRGHGDSQGARGTCDYVGQLEDDVFDIISYFEQHLPLPMVLGGHSSGAAICLRYIEKHGQQNLAGCYFIAPGITSNLESVRFDEPHSPKSFVLKFWRKKPTFNPAPAAALKHIPKMSNFKFLAAAVLPFLRHRTVMSFPGAGKMAEIEGRVLNYSFNLMASVSITQYARAFRKIKVPTVLICGEADEILHPSFLPTVAQWHLGPTLDKQVHMLPKLNHMSVVNGASRVIPQWLTERWGQAFEQEQVA